MIQVQIAAGLSEDGVDDLRWVLLEHGDAIVEATSPTSSEGGIPTEPDTVAGSLDPDPSARRRSRFPMLRAAVLLAALAGAWSMAWFVMQGTTRTTDAPVATSQGRS